MFLVGFDDVEWAPIANPPLTAIAQPTYDLGYGAGEMLLDRIEGVAGDDARTLMLDPWIVVRESTARLRAGRGGDQAHRNSGTAARRGPKKPPTKRPERGSTWIRNKVRTYPNIAL